MISNRLCKLTKEKACVLCFLSLLSVLLIRSLYLDISPKIPKTLKKNGQVFLFLEPEDSFGHENSIFFIEGYGYDHIRPRFLCSIESAALAHKNTFTVEVLMITPTLKATDGIIRLLKEYSNLRFLFLNATKFYMQSRLRDWFKHEPWNKNTKYPRTSFVEPMRYLVLHKYGGIYLDLDAMVLKPMTRDQNFVGMESNYWANSAIMGFQKGHEFMEECITRVSKTLNVSVWGANGPKLMTKILKERCGAKFPNTTLKNCDFKLYNRFVLYPISWYDREKLFKEDKNITDVLLHRPDILTLHMWNAFTSTLNLSVKDSSVFAVVARNVCPITASAANYQF